MAAQRKTSGLVVIGDGNTVIMNGGLEMDRREKAPGGGGLLTFPPTKFFK